MLKFLIPPIIGAIIGFITNDIAIKMLFHPRKPIYIGKWRVPFTPGLIPKEKARVAKSLGGVISTQLLDVGTLKKVFLSDNIIYKIRRAMEIIIDRNRTNTDTLEDLLMKFAPYEVVKNVYTNSKEDITRLIYSKLTKFQFGESIARTAFYKIKHEKIDEIAFGLLGKIINDNMIDLISKSVGVAVDKVIKDNSKEIIGSLIGTEVERYKNFRVCDLICKYEDKIPFLIEFVIDGYKKIFNDHLEQILNGIDIAKIVEDKVSSFNVQELETMIFGIMKKELRAIVYLGAVLGFVMGWINIIIPF